jgi:hypothetical protein
MQSPLSGQASICSEDLVRPGLCLAWHLGNSLEETPWQPRIRKAPMTPSYWPSSQYSDEQVVSLPVRQLPIICIQYASKFEAFSSFNYLHKVRL